MVSELFQLLDSAKTRVGILDWGLKMTTLEDGEGGGAEGSIVLLAPHCNEL